MEVYGIWYYNSLISLRVYSFEEKIVCEIPNPFKSLVCCLAFVFWNIVGFKVQNFQKILIY